MGAFTRQYYAIYTRQSSSAGAKVLSSCDVQFDICRDFMSAYGSRVAWIGERFDDVEFTGADTNRPAFQRLTRLIRARQIQKLVVYRLDRITRSLRDGAAFLEELQQHGVDLIITTAPELGMAASDRLVLNLMVSFAEFEREIIQSRITESRAYLRKHGRRLAGKLPYGYDADPTTKQLIINRKEADHVQWFFKMAASGTLPIEIAALANQRGLGTKTTVAKRSGRKTGGGPWTPRQVLSLLGNPVYMGVFAHGAGTRSGAHLAILSAAEFESAQEKIRNRRTTKAARTKQESIWPLRGKILCPKCGRPMNTHVSQKKNILFRHYRCRSFSGGLPPCRGSAFPAGEIESMVRSLVGKMEFPEPPANQTSIDSEVFRLFQAKWNAMDEASQNRSLPQIIVKISFDQTGSRIRVATNDAELLALANES